MAFRSAIHVSGSGTYTIVAGRPGSRIKVLQLVLWAREATNITLQDGANSINPGGFNLPAQSSFILDRGEPLVLGAGNALKISTTALITGWVQFTTEGFGLPAGS
jgi:hypothetical protein